MMVVKLVILTTRTPHHTYLINTLAREFEVAAVFYETRQVHAPATVERNLGAEERAFDVAQQAFEKRHFFSQVAPAVPSTIPQSDVPTVNAKGVSNAIRARGADLCVVYGCGLIKPHVFDASRHGLINVHRGISTSYRGLDSDLWAIHNDDLESIGVTIHKVDAKLDTGDVLRAARLRNVTRINLHEIRYYTTVLAVQLIHDVLHELEREDTLDGTPQQPGDYYSFMPPELKHDVREKFAAVGRPARAESDYLAGLFCFSARSRSELCILLYHGVTSTPGHGIENYSGKHLDVASFESQMQYVSSRCTLMSMEDVADHCRRNERFPPNAVAVTFDDAFENVYSVALPIMRTYGIPFTFYVTTGFVDTEAMFWVDIIEDCLNRTAATEIAVAGFDRPFRLSHDGDKQAACERTKSRCKRVTRDQKDEIIASLISETGITPSVESCVNYRKITWLQLSELAREPLATVGGHTHQHNILSQLDNAGQRFEIETSLSLLRARLGLHVKHYSYPEGQAHHYDARAIATLRNKGIECCPSAIPGLNATGSDPFQLRRVMVGFMGTPFPYLDPMVNPEPVHTIPPGSRSRECPVRQHGRQHEGEGDG